MDLTERIEVVAGRLYYTQLKAPPSVAAKRQYHMFSIDDQLIYYNFFLDFGPLNLAALFRFCNGLNTKLRDCEKTIYFYSSAHPHRRTNAVLLVAAWSVLFMHRTPEEAMRPFQRLALVPFHDASPCVCTFKLTVLDCLRGLQKARQYRFADFTSFDIASYEHYEQVEHGDMNWLVRGRFLAFAGPHNRAELTTDGYRTLTPLDYIPYFKKHNVTLVIRLNKKYYDESQFTAAGIKHAELYYLDGSVPPAKLLARFIELCESTEGAIAVHCKAGLGRTGTCIGCYLMKHYRLSAAEVIGWMRLCRPGSVIGQQQQYMAEMQQLLWREGDRLMRPVSSSRSSTVIETIQSPPHSEPRTQLGSRSHQFTEQHRRNSTSAVGVPSAALAQRRHTEYQLKLSAQAAPPSLTRDRYTRLLAQQHAQSQLRDGRRQTSAGSPAAYAAAPSQGDLLRSRKSPQRTVVAARG